ncbi:hypothetical protein [Mycolicibacterium sp.]|uniref:hypothetical protein n=1 Tax=Mycolicibacterium sp. TaxID=2320850 RepID=UPI001D3AF9CE|nr:hypothetical protein [Mycolicibacterium sp.]MCB1291108.1 hypothetical protein [Mycobacterium sp.]MCB9409166.1 hypothetical protein [Mycolicibacterium sp.]
MTSRWQTLIRVVGCGALMAGTVWLAPQAAAQDCAPGFERNPYTPECLAPVNTPTINGVPCVPSNLGLCSSFLQNQQPARVPRTSVG